MADAALQELLGRGLEEFLSAESGNHQAPVSPVVTTLINILHADLWRHWGYAPTFALGHSIGELVAAHIAGCFSLEDAAKLVCGRGRLMATTAVAGGQMASLHATEAEVIAAMDALPAAQREAVLARVPRSQLCPFSIDSATAAQ